MAKNTEKAATVTASDRALVVTEESQGMIMPNTIGVIEKLDQSFLSGVDVEHVIRLEEGQGIRGIFLGAGPVVEVGNPQAGMIVEREDANGVVTAVREPDMRPIGTWRFQVRPGLVVRLLGSARLDTEFRGMAAGVRVRVGKLGQVNTTRGRRVNDYVIAIEKTEK